MEQALYKQEHVAEEQAIQSETDIESGFTERELVLERFANTPMAYTINGTTYKAGGSYEAVLLCDFLQNDKLPAAFLAIKFQVAADLIATLDEDELKPADEKISPPEESQPLIEPGEDQTEASTDVRSATNDSSGDGPPELKAMQSPNEVSISKKLPPVIEQPARAPSNDTGKNDENDKGVKTLEVVENSLSEPNAGDSSAETMPLTSVTDEPLEEVHAEATDESIESGHAEDELQVGQEEEIPHEELILGVEPPTERDDSENVAMIDENTEMSSVEELDLADDELEVEEVNNYENFSVPVESTPTSLEEGILLAESADEDSVETFLPPGHDLTEETAEAVVETEPEQEAVLDKLNELLINLSAEAEEDNQDELEVEEKEANSARTTQLYKCLEAQVQVLSERQEDELSNGADVEAIRITLIEIFDEAGFDDAELFAKLYLEKYGIDGLLDTIQPHPISKAQDRSQLTEQYHKIARFATRLMIHHDGVDVRSNVLLASAV